MSLPAADPVTDSLPPVAAPSVAAPAEPCVVRLKPRRAQPFFGRHPWVFAGAIHSVAGDPRPGDAVRLVADDGRFVAHGLFNPASAIRVRLYSWHEDQPPDEALWSARLDEAFALRKRLGLLAGDDTAARLVFSEADGLSGLVVDRYGRWLVMQLTSAALAARKEVLIRLLVEKLHPAGILLRTEKGIREEEGLVEQDGPVWGAPPPRPLFLAEHGCRWGVDLLEGQKTGFFLDQRENRRAAAGYLDRARLLDVFCYGGGFGITALVQGTAKEVLGIDVSEPALTLARANAELNGVAAHARYEKSDAFAAMERLRDAGEKFDAVVLDPPKMARHRPGIERALRGYHGLNRLALDLLPPGGILVTCSCTGLVGREEFESMLADAAAQADRRIQILEFRGAAPDHPVSVHCLENAYLKCCILRVV